MQLKQIRAGQTLRWRQRNYDPSKPINNGPAFIDCRVNVIQVNTDKEQVKASIDGRDPQWFTKVYWVNWQVK